MKLYSDGQVQNNVQYQDNIQHNIHTNILVIMIIISLLPANFITCIKFEELVNFGGKKRNGTVRFVIKITSVQAIIPFTPVQAIISTHLLCAIWFTCTFSPHSTQLTLHMYMIHVSSFSVVAFFTQYS